MGNMTETSVQYNDFRGTVAADISDHCNLVGFLNSKGIDTQQYNPIGLNLYLGEGVAFNCFVGVRCIDRNNTENGRHIVELKFYDIPVEEIFSYFKRFEISILNRSYDDGEIDEEIAVDDLLNKE